MGIKEDRTMTILVDDQQEACEVNIGGQSGFSGGSVLKLSRQNSFLSRQNSLFGRQNSLLPDFNSLPDFTNLLTPNLQKTVFNFDDSFYQDSKMSEESLKNVTAYEIENIPPQCIKQEALSPSAMSSDNDQDFASIMAAVTSANTMTTSPVHSPAGSPPCLADLKQESMDSESEMVTIRRDGSYELYHNKTGNTTEEEKALMELQSKIQKASRDLNIPKNPWLWTMEEVNRWLFWVLSTYEMQPTFTLDMDGTKLCLANLRDLEQRVNNQSGAADIIGIEMDLWKQAFTIETSQHHQQWQAKQQMQQTVYTGNDAHKVYTDLSESRPATSQHNSSSSISVIPTPVSTTAPVTTQLLSHQQQPAQCLPPNTLNLQNQMMQTMTLNEIHQQMAYEYQQQVRGSPVPNRPHVPHISQISPSSSFSSSGGWDSPRSSESGFSGQSGGYTTEEESRECSPAPPAAMPRGPLPHSRNSIKLWQFLRHLLDQPGLTCIRWIDREKGIFKIEDSQRVAKMWGQRKNRPAMNYDKLSRSIRQYYKKKIIKKTENSKRLVYQFCTPYL